MCDPTALPSTEQTDRDPLWLVRCSCQQRKDLQMCGELKSEGSRAEKDSTQEEEQCRIIRGVGKVK